MSEQRFPAGAAPSLRIANGGGDISVEVWDEDEILVKSHGRTFTQYREGDTLAIEGCPDELEIRVPARTAVTISQHSGDVRVEGVRLARIERAACDVDLADLAEGAEIGQVSGDLRVERVPRVVGPGPVHGDADLADVQRIEIGRVNGNLSTDNTLVIIVGNVGGDMEADGLVERLQVGSIGGDLDVETRGAGEIVIDSLGGDIEVEGDLSSFQCSNVGGDLRVEGRVDRATCSNVGGDLQVGRARELRAGNVGGDIKAQGMERVEIGSAGGDCKLTRLVGAVDLGSVGGNLTLQGDFSAGSSSQANVSGDTSLQLSREPNLTLNASIGGDLRGVDVGVQGSRKRVNLCYGAGEASLNLRVGGDLRISGAGAPTSSSSSASDARFDFDSLGRELGDLGRELGRMGRELGSEIGAAFASEGAARGGAWAEEAGRKLEEQARRFQEQTEARARRVEEHARLRVKINEREWQLDPERLERIKEQARRAAAEGVSGAIEAVERALGRLRVPPTPPTPPTAATGATIRIVVDEDEGQKPAPSREQERESILRMIAEGRISPEEGDLLLDALG